MNISSKVLDKAVAAKIITASQAEALIQFIAANPEQGPGFNLTNVLYYFGGLIAIGAMTLFMTLGWESFGGWGIFFISLVYALAGLYLTSRFHQKGYALPAGICATFVICLVPLAIYGIQVAMGWWPDQQHYRNYHFLVNWTWMYMELGTLLAGCILAFFYRYPFMVMPIAVTLWYMSMDVASIIAGGTAPYLLAASVSLYFGLFMVLLAFLVDLRSRHSADYAFWLYLFGVIAFWGGLTGQPSSNEWSRLVYFCINLLLIGIGVVLVRKVFVIFGGIGCCLYIGHIAFVVFENSVLFPIALTVIGLAFVYLGTLWQKHERDLTQKAQAFLPAAIRELLQSRH